MKEKITKILADFLGIEPGDITEDDSLTEDLHMTASDLTDFAEILKGSGIEANESDFVEIDTVEDLYEKYI